MKRVLSNYYIEVLSPLHIGNGEALFPATYLHKQNKLFVYNIEDIVKYVDNPEKLMNIMLSTNRVSIQNILSYDKINKLKPQREIKTYPDLKNIERQEIEMFVHESMKLYLPGSSLKGAISHAIEYHTNSEANEFHSSFVISDLYFKSVASVIQRGIRITSAKKKNDFRRNRQDNYKEWIYEGKTIPINAYFRNESNFNILKSIYHFTNDYLQYQKSYVNYLLENINQNKNIYLDLQDMVDFYIDINTPEEPILILGSNTHRYSKSNELLRNKKYQKTAGKNSAHPVSRLLVADLYDVYTFPGLVHLKKL